MGKIKLIVGLCIFLVNGVYGQGNIGDPCSSGFECEPYLACHNGICDQNCYSHFECMPGQTYCTRGNTCGPSLYFQCCDSSVVCPTCSCGSEVCSMGDVTYDVDGTLCCTGANLDCVYKRTFYPSWHFNYLTDKRNVYKCEWASWDMSNPVCQEDYVWDINKYPQRLWTYGSLPIDGCVLRSILASEFPTSIVYLVGFMCLLCPAIVYLYSRTSKR